MYSLLIQNARRIPLPKPAAMGTSECGSKKKRKKEMRAIADHDHFPEFNEQLNGSYGLNLLSMRKRRF